VAKQKEIEIKWRTPTLKRRVFKNAIEEYFTDILRKKFRFKNSKGDDVYYCNRGGVLRHRYSGDCHELTTKGRLSFDSIKIRREINLKLAKGVDPFDVACAMKMVKFKSTTSIYKDCDIYFIDENGAEVQIVWYKTKHSGTRGPWKRFIEVEIAGASQRKSVRMLNRWAAIVEEMFGLSPEDRSKLSLFEIYSGRRYQHA
jgi:adenylate cyclase class IV